MSTRQIISLTLCCVLALLVSVWQLGKIFGFSFGTYGGLKIDIVP